MNAGHAYLTDREKARPLALERPETTNDSNPGRAQNEISKGTK
jgi:hypothetical protein